MASPDIELLLVVHTTAAGREAHRTAQPRTLTHVSNMNSACMLVRCTCEFCYVCTIMLPRLPQAILMYLGSKPDLVRQYSTAQLALVKVRRPLVRPLPSLSGVNASARWCWNSGAATVVMLSVISVERNLPGC